MVSTKNHEEETEEEGPSIQVRMPKTNTVFVIPPVQAEAEQAEVVGNDLYHVGMPVPPSPCTVGLSGEITEEKAGEIIAALLTAKEYSKLPWSAEELSTFSPKERIKLPPWKLMPIRFVVSTYGGSVTEMFAVYDTLVSLKKEGYIVETHGIGKVMSAGVPLLAAGSPDHRSAGPNCRLMMHSVSSINGGRIDDLENEFKEAKYAQNAYIKCLVSNTQMNADYIKSVLAKKIDVYLTSKEAQRLGIIDYVG